MAILASANRWERPIRWAVPFGAVVLVAYPHLLRGDWLPIAIFLPLVGIAFAVPLVLDRATRARIFAQSPDANLELQVSIDSEHIEVRGRSGTSHHACRGIIRARETADGFILQAQPGTARYLPKSAIRSASDLEQIRAWIQAKGIPTT